MQKYEGRDAVQLQYMKLLKLFIQTVGGWPAKLLHEKEHPIFTYHRYHAPIQSVVVTFAEMYYIYKYQNSSDFFVKAHCYIVTMLSVLTTVRTALPLFPRYNEIVRYFLKEFHLIHYTGGDEYGQKIYKLVDKGSLFFSVFLLSMIVNGESLFNLAPLYINYESNVFKDYKYGNVTKIEMSVYWVLPGLEPLDHLYFYGIYNLFLCYNCAASICSIDLLLSLMLFQIIGHILILTRNLEDIPRPKKLETLTFNDDKGVPCQVTVDMYDREENEMVHKKLVQSIQYHRFIVKFTSDLSNFFGFMLAFNYAFHLISGCLLLLVMSAGDISQLSRFGPVSIVIFGQLIQISITFEVINTVSTKLIDTVYQLPWECMDTRNRRITQFLLSRVQSPIQVTAMGMMPVGVTTMAGILKTTFSYFTFLSSMDLS